MQTRGIKTSDLQITRRWLYLWATAARIQQNFCTVFMISVTNYIILREGKRATNKARRPVADSGCLRGRGEKDDRDTSYMRWRTGMREINTNYYIIKQVPLKSFFGKIWFSQKHQRFTGNFYKVLRPRHFSGNLCFLNSFGEWSSWLNKVTAIEN